METATLMNKQTRATLLHSINVPNTNAINRPAIVDMLTTDTNVPRSDASLRKKQHQN